MPTSLARRLTLVLGTRGARGVQRTLGDIDGRINKITASARIMRTVSVGAFLAVTLAMGGSVLAAVQFESAFAGVVKTVDDAADEMGNLTAIGERLRGEFRQLSTEIPTTAAGLARIGEISGQLGVRSDNIIEFTKTIAQLQETTNILGEEGALNLARFLNITKVAPANVDRLGSSIVALGNNFAAQESQILHLATNLSVLNGSVGISAQNILALSTTIEASGGQAEAAATAFQRLALDIDKSVGEGGSRLESFAKIAGVSAQEFARVFREDAFEGLKLFLRGLQDNIEAGGNLAVLLDDVGLANVRLVREVGKVAANLDQLSEAQRIANDAFNEGTALQREFGIRVRTTASQLAILRNVVTDIAIGIGDQLLPILVTVFTDLRRVLIDNRQALIAFGGVLSFTLNVIVNITKAVIDWIVENREIIKVLGSVALALGVVSLAIAAITSPIVLVGLAVVLGIEVWNRWGDTVIKRTEEVREFMKPFVNTLARLFVFVGTVATISIGRILSFFKSAFDEMLVFAKPFFDFLSSAWSKILSVVDKVAGAISGIWNDTMAKIDDITKENAGSQIDLLEEIALEAKRIFETDYVGFIASGVERGVEVFDAGLDKMKQALLDFGTSTGTRRTGAGATPPSALAAAGGSGSSFGFGVQDEAPAEPIPPVVLDRFNELIMLAETFDEKLQIIGITLGSVFGTLAASVFGGLVKVTKNTFATMSKLSAGFFTGERKSFFDFKELSKVVWAEVKAAALEGIAGILKSRAEQWAIEAAAAAISGNFPRAAALGALAVAAGGSAAVLTGAAAGIREKAQREFDEATQRSEDEISGTRGDGESSGTLGATTRRGTVTQLPARNITISPVTQFIANDGGSIFVGPEGIEEAAESLNDLILKAVEAAQEGGNL